MPGRVPATRVLIQGALVFAMAIGASLSPATASAQWFKHPPARARKNMEGVVNFHPTLAVGLYYDTNPYRAATRPEGDLAFTISPIVGVDFRGSEVKAYVRGHYRLRKFFSIRLVKPDSHDDLDILGDFGLQVGMKVRPEQIISFEFSDLLERTSRALDSSEVPDNRFSLMNQVSNQLEMKVHGRPGSALTISPGISWSLSRFSSKDGRGIDARVTDFGTYHDVKGTLLAQWRFFPRTQALIDFEVGRHMFSDRIDASELALEGGTVVGLEQNAASFWKLQGGVEGRFGERTTLRLILGYAGAYFDDGALAYRDQSKEMRAQTSLVQGRGLMGTVHFVTLPLPDHRVAVGFTRKYEFSYFAAYYLTNRPFAKYDGTFFEWLRLRTEFGVDIRELRGSPDAFDGGRNDVQLDFTVSLGADVLEWLSLAVDYKLLSIVWSENPSQQFVDHMIGFTVTAGY